MLVVGASGESPLTEENENIIQHFVSHSLPDVERMQYVGITPCEVLSRGLKKALQIGDKVGFHLHSSIFVNLLVNLPAILKLEHESRNSREKVDRSFGCYFF